MTITLSRSLAVASLLALGFTACGGDPPVTPPITNPKPVISSFTSDKSMVTAGETVTLSYAVTNATQITLATDAGTTFATKPEASGTVVTAPINATTVFVITAQGAGGSATQRLTVTLDTTGVHIVSFTANPPVVAMGGNTTLRWATTGAKAVRLLRGQTELVNDTSPGNTGEHEVMIGSPSETFTLIASNDTGMDQKMVTVTVAAPIELRAFKVRPQVFTGASAMISVTWTTANATSLALTANGVAVPGFTGMVGTGTISVMVTDTTRFELTVGGLNGPLSAVQIVGRAQGETEPNDSPMTANPLTSGAQAEITEDDVDYFSITVPAGGNVTIQTTDGMGGCNFDSVIALFDPNGDELTSDDDGGAPVNMGDGRCSLIDPGVDPAVRDLPAGTYTIEVRGFDSMSIGTYALVVAIGNGGCGNGFLEESLMEQCDDANMAANDGCSATCAFEILGTVSQPGDMTFTGALGDQATAAYVLNITTETYVAIDTFSPTAGVCPTADLVTGILAPDGSVVGSDDDDGEGACAAIHPSRDAFAKLMPGRYTVLVLSGDGAAVAQFAVRIRTFGMGCGNGVLEMGEACDDNNMAAMDGCNASCQIEYAGTVTGPPSEQTFDTVITPGRRITYEVVLNGPAYVFAETGAPTIGVCTSTSSDTVLTLTSSTGREIATNDDISMMNRCSRINPATRTPPGPLLQAGRYSLQLRGYNAMVAVPAVQTLVRIFPMGCNNGIQEGTEQCDDGNMMNGDGCSTMCRYDGGITGETEPNDTNQQANALGNVRTATVTFAGNIGNMGVDVDVFSFEVTGAAANLTARTYLRRNEPASCAGDSELRLYDANNNLVTKNDDGQGGSLCSEISTTETGTAASTLAPGRYYLRINEFGSNMNLSGYLFDVRIR